MVENMKQNVDKNFDDLLKIYHRVEKEWWDGIEVDQDGQAYYSEKPCGMRYYLKKEVYQMNHELPKDLYEQNTWSVDITGNYTKEELDSFLVDPTAICVEFNLEQ